MVSRAEAQGRGGFGIRTRRRGDAEVSRPAEGLSIDREVALEDVFELKSGCAARKNPSASPRLRGKQSSAPLRLCATKIR